MFALKLIPDTADGLKVLQTALEAAARHYAFVSGSIDDLFSEDQGVTLRMNKMLLERIWQDNLFH